MTEINKNAQSNNSNQDSWLTNDNVLEQIKHGLEDAATGKVSDLGDFTQYLTETDD